MMQTNSPDYCKRCYFYHGANKILCAIHPYGPSTDICSDFAPKVNSSEPAKTVKDHLLIRSFRHWDGWTKTLIISVLFSVVGYSFAVWRIIISPPTTPNTKAELPIGRNANKPSATNKFR